MVLFGLLGIISLDYLNIGPFGRILAFTSTSCRITFPENYLNTKASFSCRFLKEAPLDQIHLKALLITRNTFI